MSTTTKRVMLAVPIVVFAWLGIMAGVMRFSDAAPAAVVPFPSRAFMEALPSDVAILGLTRVSITLANSPDLTRSLYQAGALAVLPAGLTGCLPLSPAERAVLAKR